MKKVAARPVIVFQPDGVEIPAGITDLARFRAWVHSDDFPERGRIDWIDGRMEVDCLPEDLNTHGSPKSAIAIRLGTLIQEKKRGVVYIDRARLTNPDADLSAEPDVLVLLFATVRSGRARLVPKASLEEGRFIEIEGTADLVVECVSDSSRAKDARRLRDAYHRAGVREYWLVDARTRPATFDVLLRQPRGYEPAPAGRGGYRKSGLLKRGVRLSLVHEEAGLDLYRLDVR
ncbi:MAG: Uma2 family endonuclease [Planctomycetes bacterium]|nr:Uma2 family endonuclease [Planctomycetota bacterium]